MFGMGTGVTPPPWPPKPVVKGCAQPVCTGGAASLCTTSGGTEGTAMCCTMTGDYPDGCATGPCGCAPADSHEVKVCVCPDTQCFDPTVGCKTL